MEAVLVTPNYVLGAKQFWAHALYCSGVAYSHQVINDNFIFPNTTAIETSVKNRLTIAVLEDGEPIGIVSGLTSTLVLDDSRFRNLTNHVAHLVGDRTFIMPIFAIDPRFLNKQRAIFEELFFALYASAAGRGSHYFTTLVYVSSKSNIAFQTLCRDVLACELVDTLRVEVSARGHRDLSFYRTYLE